jgi:hypothetical protein
MDKYITACHDTGWLWGVLVCTPTTLDFLTIDQTNIICFESHLMCGLGLPPSKFLVSILNYIGCELFICTQMSFQHSAASPCYVSAGLAFRLTPACSSISIPLVAMSTRSSPAMGWRYAATIRMSTWMSPSRAIGKAPPKDGSTSTRATLPNGWTCTFFRHWSLISGRILKKCHDWRR